MAFNVLMSNAFLGILANLFDSHISIDMQNYYSQVSTNLLWKALLWYLFPSFISSVYYCNVCSWPGLFEHKAILYLGHTVHTEECV